MSNYLLLQLLYDPLFSPFLLRSGLVDTILHEKKKNETSIYVLSKFSMGVRFTLILYLILVVEFVSFNLSLRSRSIAMYVVDKANHINKLWCRAISWVGVLSPNAWTPTLQNKKGFTSLVINKRARENLFLPF